jgi:hypothetical protein
MGIQVTQVDPEIDLKDEGYEPRNEKDAYNYDLCKSVHHCVENP